MEPEAPKPMRVSRALAVAGVASRRASERLVLEGRVRVNGEPAAIGQLVGSTDRLEVDGTEVQPEPLRVYLVHKAGGTIASARDPQGRPTVLEGLPEDVRLYPVGRLDLATTGALLVTNDGDLAHRLMHPRSKVPKVYEALVEGRVSAETVRRLRRGVELEDGPTLPARVEVMRRLHPKATWLEIELTEGRNRQVRRMCEAVGHPALRLHRSRYAGIGLGRLDPGDWRPLGRHELARLAALVGLER